jgi:hypothetical protein
MPATNVEKCYECKYCNLDGEYGPECEYDPPQDITWVHPHPWPLVNPQHKACGKAVKK